MNIVEQAMEKLEKYNQNKIIEIISKIIKEEQEKLSKQIMEIDFDEIFNLYENKDNKIDSSGNSIEPIKCVDKDKMSEEQKEELSKIGEKIIKNNQYAVVTMAGGQGTRLGFNGPKGTFKLDIGKNGKYIFEILIEKLKKAKEIYGVELNWYIMTSIENNDETINFFKEHNYFDYPKEKIKFFKQKSLPIIDEEKNLLVDKNYNIKEASDGNGSVYKSLRLTNMLEDMKQNGIKWVYICGVDNIMVNMVDSILLGLTIKNNMPSASKSVQKSYPEEKVGVFCKRNNRPTVIEYIDMTKEMVYEKNSSGELVYNQANFVSHLLSIDSIEKISLHDLNYHCAHKKNSYIDENLQEIVPDEPNTYKFETFVFDGFEYLNDMIIMSVNRDEEFSPIKNATGVDSPETAIQAYAKKFDCK